MTQPERSAGPILSRVSGQESQEQAELANGIEEDFSRSVVDWRFNRGPFAVEGCGKAIYRFKMHNQELQVKEYGQ